MPGPKLTSDDLKKRYSRNVANPYRSIVRARAIRCFSRPISCARLPESGCVRRVRVDSVWTNSATGSLRFLTASTPGWLCSVRRTQSIKWEMARIDIQTKLPTVLSPVQPYYAARCGSGIVHREDNERVANSILDRIN